MMMMNRITTLEEYSHFYQHIAHPPPITLFGNVFPFVVHSARVHREIGPFANMPAVKRIIRYTSQRLQAVDALVNTVKVMTSNHSPPGFSTTLREAMLAFQSVREEVGSALNRFYLGGTAININLDKLSQRLRYSINVLASIVQSVLTASIGLQVTMDDNEVDLRNSIFDRTLLMDSASEQLAVVVFNPHSHMMITNLRLAVAFPSFCLYDEQHKLLPQQIYNDFENNHLLLATVKLLPLTSTVFYLEACKHNHAIRTHISTLSTTLSTNQSQTIGNNRLHVKINSEGMIEEIGFRGAVYPFQTVVGYYIGTSARACRTGQYVIMMIVNDDNDDDSQ